MGLDPISWAERFAAALVVGGERVPFERVLAHHLDEVTELRSASGLTWRSMASLLARAGAGRADGSLISSDQLRVGYARLMRQAGKTLDEASRKADAKGVNTPSAAWPGSDAPPDQQRLQPAPLSPERSAEESRVASAASSRGDLSGDTSASGHGSHTERPSET